MVLANILCSNLTVNDNTNDKLFVNSFTGSSDKQKKTTIVSWILYAIAWLLIVICAVTEA